jgi:hypothetical protein
MGTSSTTYFRSKKFAGVKNKWSVPYYFAAMSCGTRSKVSFISNPAQISLKHSSQLTNKTTLATSFVFIRHVFHCVLHVCLFFDENYMP